MYEILGSNLLNRITKNMGLPKNHFNILLNETALFLDKLLHFQVR